jgi:AraC-like DNA-binding protein
MMREVSEYWRHPRFGDLGLLKARFTRHRYDLHTHPTYVIALIVEGCERVRIGRQVAIAPAGAILVVNPEEPHDGEAGVEGGWAYRTFYPSVPLLTAVAGELGRDRAPLFPRGIIEDADLVRAMRAAHVGSTDEDAASAETSMLLALRRLILRHGDWGDRLEQREGAGSRRRLALYEQAIERDPTAALDLQLFADAGGVTRFQVIRDFKKTSGLTPAAFIRNRRLRRAERLIEQGAGLAEAAFAAGFSDQSHLSRTFRALRGVTPGTFREAQH